MTNIVNYALNPSFEVNVTDDWTAFHGGAGGSMNLDATQYYVGTKSCRIRAGNAYELIRSTTGLSIANNTTASIQARVRCSADPTGGKAWLRVTDLGVTVAIVNATVASNGAWEYLAVSVTNTTGGARTVYMDCINYFNDSATDVWFDACQLELTLAASAYTDGAQGEGHSWAGAAHNSVSTWTEPASVGFVTVIPYMMV